MRWGWERRRERKVLEADSKEQSIRADDSPGTYVKFDVGLVPAVSVFLPEASSEVGHQFPDEGEEGVVVGILGDLQVPIDKGAEVVGEKLREDVVGEKLAQVQAVLQKEADELGSVLDESHKHDFLKVRRLRTESRKDTHTGRPTMETQGFSFPATSCFPPQSNSTFHCSCNPV